MSVKSFIELPELEKSTIKIGKIIEGNYNMVNDILFYNQFFYIQKGVIISIKEHFIEMKFQCKSERIFGRIHLTELEKSFLEYKVGTKLSGILNITNLILKVLKIY